MSLLVCLHCGCVFQDRGVWGSKPFSRHVERCEKATPEERKYYARVGRWPKKKLEKLEEGETK